MSYQAAKYFVVYDTLLRRDDEDSEVFQGFATLDEAVKFKNQVYANNNDSHPIITTKKPW